MLPTTLAADGTITFNPLGTPGDYTGSRLLGAVTVSVNEALLPEGYTLSTNNSPQTAMVAAGGQRFPDIGYTVGTEPALPAASLASGGTFNDDTAFGGAGNDLPRRRRRRGFPHRRRLARPGGRVLGRAVRCHGAGRRRRPAESRESPCVRPDCGLRAERHARGPLRDRRERDDDDRHHVQRCDRRFPFPKSHPVQLPDRLHPRARLRHRKSDLRHPARHRFAAHGGQRHVRRDDGDGLPIQPGRLRRERERRCFHRDGGAARPARCPRRFSTRSPTAPRCRARTTTWRAAAW